MTAFLCYRVFFPSKDSNEKAGDSVDALQKSIYELPTKILQSIQSSTNVQKGSVAELIGYLKLQAEYDQVIPLNNVVDFLAIRYSKDNIEGTVDFIEIKSGDKARLSFNQQALQKLLLEKKVNFVRIKIQTMPAETVNEDSSQGS